ncbi:serine hydrolase [Luteipulveratus sp. YIM 133132]|uniref:serine hydrolase domain-containing protein n=1 Tax=Luteipulveratus flavus TaxID=3031728 RepID=UPI0023B13EE6|nr:serine hydrolase domain-containing protein [Luteipulveratus sp. YIM 133132]MDE9366909.1 serine hydrolase [Luteipulveratus sp. YIM 133132]
MDDSYLTARPAGVDDHVLRLGLDAVRRVQVEPGPAGVPLLPGAVALALYGNRVVAREASGWALAYADRDGTPLAAEQRVPMTPETVFDIASITKVFTALVLAQLVEEGAVELGRPVVSYLPEFVDKDAVTVEQLALHTSGLPWWLPLWRDWPDRNARLAAVLRCPLEAPAGTRYTYSDLNLITVQLLLEHVTGQTLDLLVQQRISGPLGMCRTTFGRADATRCAATEDEHDAGRGMVRGEVHDENAWSLGGVSGHAGLFSTADDLARLAQCLIDDGRYDGGRLLGECGLSLATTDRRGVPGEGRSLVLDIDRPAWMGALSGPRTVGHTGFTGTSLAVDLDRGAAAILLTNRVHPSRERGSIHPVRAAWATAVADAIGG